MPSAATWTQSAPSESEEWTPRRGAGAPGGRYRRRPAVLAAGAALGALGALAGVWAVNTSGHRDAVLVMARSVPVGSVVKDGDLAVAEVAVDGPVRSVPASARAQLVGKVATLDLTAGALLAPGQVADTAGVPPAGKALVVVTVPASRVPAVGLRDGDAVQVVYTSGQTDATGSTATGPDAQAPPESIPATVARVQGPDADSVVSVDVMVAQGDAATLAARAASGQVALVLLPGTLG